MIVHDGSFGDFGFPVVESSQAVTPVQPQGITIRGGMQSVGAIANSPALENRLRNVEAGISANAKNVSANAKAGNQSNSVIAALTKRVAVLEQANLNLGKLIQQALTVAQSAVAKANAMVVQPMNPSTYTAPYPQQPNGAPWGSGSVASNGPASSQTIDSGPDNSGDGGGDDDSDMDFDDDDDSDDE